MFLKTPSPPSGERYPCLLSLPHSAIYMLWSVWKTSCARKGFPGKAFRGFSSGYAHEDLDYVAPFDVSFVQTGRPGARHRDYGKTFRPIGRESAVPFEGGRLCERHGYEIEPCTHCSTGWDWLAKSNEAESEATRPPRFAGGL